MAKLIQYFLIGLFLITGVQANAQTYNILDFGAKPDGVTMNTLAIQKAIDQCSQSGGKVLVPAGTFLSGTLHLKSHIEIHIEAKGVLKGSPMFKDYPDNKVSYQNAFTHSSDGKSFANKALLFAEDIEDIAITGSGTIDGSGDSREFNLGNDDTPQSRLRPCMLLVINCKNIRLSDLFMTNSAYWMQNYLGCDGLELKRLRIYNQSNYNQDGIDVDAKNVLIEDCVIDADDDGICFKSHDRERPVENVIVKNCTIGSNCNAIKFGTMSLGPFRHFTISNCVIKKASVDHIRHWQTNLQFIGQPITVISGVAIESVDGSAIEDISISDLQMTDVQTPIFIVLGNRGRKQFDPKAFYKEAGIQQPLDKPVYGSITNINIKNITATGYSKMSSSITAFPGHYVKNIKLNHIVFNEMGGGTLPEAQTTLKENPAGYPENRMYGMIYPSTGFFVRHAENVTMDNIVIHVRQPDHRPVIVLEDVSGFKISSFNIDLPVASSAVMRVLKSKNISIENPMMKMKGKPLIQLLDGTVADIKIKGFLKYKGWLVSNH